MVLKVQSSDFEMQNMAFCSLKQHVLHCNMPHFAFLKDIRINAL